MPDATCTACGAHYLRHRAKQTDVCPRCSALAREARRREARVLAGMCSRCRVRPAREGKRTCAECIEERMAYEAARKEGSR